MSALRSAIEEFIGEDLAGVADHQLEADVAEISQLMGLLEAQKARRIREVDIRKSYTRDGGISTTAWLARTLDVGSGAAGRDLMVARRLEHMPRTRAGFENGGVSVAKVVILAQASAAYSDQFVDDEEMLLSFASELSVRDFRRAVEYWKNLQAEQGSVDVLSPAHQRWLRISRTFGGMVRIDGQLDPESGEIVMEAIAAVTAQADRSSAASAAAGELLETAAERRAAGLVDLCRRSLDTGHAVVGGMRPHITVVVDAETLAKRQGKMCELARIGTISPEAARRLACDAGVSRVIVGPKSEPLDVGRTMRTVSAAQRRALTVRDGRCRFPGCDRPPPWCDGHHVKHWADGGETKLDNLVLLCRRHHSLVHEGGFGVGEGPIFTRPDGSRIDDG